MKNTALYFLAFTLFSVAAQAEVAVLCGKDVTAFAENNDSKAAVHVDLDDRIIASKKDVKFLDVFGKTQTVVSAKMIGKKIEVKTKKETYLFDGLSGSESSKLRVTLANKTKYPCISYED